MTLELAFAIGALAVIVGSLLQRVSGTGVGLVVAPTLALLLGPVVGIFLTNATTVISATILTIVVWRRVDWRRAGLILAAAVPGAAFGAWLVAHLSTAWLSIVIGSVVILALAVTFTAKRVPEVDGLGPILTTGAIGGMFNTTAGVAAPALVIYSRVSRWEHSAFAATLQPVFLGMGLLSLLMKTLFGATGFTTLPPWWVLPLYIASVLLGVWLGKLVAKRLAPHRAQQVAIAVAGLGGVVALVRGITSL